MNAPMPFQEAVDFFRSKVNLPSAAWTDFKEGAHARAFTVAGATTYALVEDFRAALDKAIAEGRTKEDFLKDFDRIVAAHGWSYNGGRGWRAAVIYNTNLRTARAAGRWAEIERNRAVRPYIRYSAVMDGRTRPLHKEWHGVVLPVDHLFWETNYPPNGWNCRCSALSVSAADLARRGWKVSAAPKIKTEARPVKLADGTVEVWTAPKGVDTGFGYNPGKAGWLRGGVPPALQHPLPPWGTPPAPPAALPPPPAPSPLGAEILPEGLSDEEYAQAFLSPFGATLTRPAAFRDAAGHLMAVGRELLLDQAGRWKVKKRGRERYMAALAAALKDPDEIWLTWAGAAGRPVLRRHYLKWLTLPDGKGCFASFEWTAKGWFGKTIFPPDAEAYMASRRLGALLYKRN